MAIKDAADKAGEIFHNRGKNFRLERSSGLPA